MFISDGVVVEVVIKSVERYDPMIIKPTESEAEHRLRLWLALYVAYDQVKTQVNQA